jgi:hypothetical protein
MHHHSINAERFEISEVIPQADVLLEPTWGVSTSSHYSNPIHPLLTTSANSHFSTPTPPANNCFLPSIANTHADIDTRLFSLLKPSHCFLFIHGAGGRGAPVNGYKVAVNAKPSYETSSMNLFIKAVCRSSRLS